MKSPHPHITLRRLSAGIHTNEVIGAQNADNFFLDWSFTPYSSVFHGERKPASTLGESTPIRRLL